MPYCIYNLGFQNQGGDAISCVGNAVPSSQKLEEKVGSPALPDFVCLTGSSDFFESKVPVKNTVCVVLVC